jgi:hypothetical protein
MSALSPKADIRSAGPLPMSANDAFLLRGEFFRSGIGKYHFDQDHRSGAVPMSKIFVTIAGQVETKNRVEYSCTRLT